jgi:L-rhamnose 1-epimerase
MRIACKMKLFSNCEAEYKKRHEHIWPEMKAEIKKHGCSNYSIFLDEETHTIFSYLEVEDKLLWDSMAETAICAKWWNYMKDIMETNPDNSPKCYDLENMFYLP